MASAIRSSTEGVCTLTPPSRLVVDRCQSPSSASAPPCPGRHGRLWRSISPYAPLKKLIHSGMSSSPSFRVKARRTYNLLFFRFIPVKIDGRDYEFGMLLLEVCPSSSYWRTTQTLQTRATPSTTLHHTCPNMKLSPSTAMASMKACAGLGDKAQVVYKTISPERF